MYILRDNPEVLIVTVNLQKRKWFMCDSPTQISNLIFHEHMAGCEVILPSAVVLNMFSVDNSI